MNRCLIFQVSLQLHFLVMIHRHEVHTHFCSFALAKYHGICCTCRPMSILVHIQEYPMPEYSFQSNSCKKSAHMALHRLRTTQKADTMRMAADASIKCRNI